MSSTQIDHSPKRFNATIPVAGFVLACAGTYVCFAKCGATLALFLFGFFLLTPLLPPLVLTQQRTGMRLFIAACVVDGIAVVWLFAVALPQVRFLQWLACYVALIAYATLVSGVAIALVRFRIAPFAASAIAVVLSLIWLTTPVWLMNNLSDAAVARLIPIHPLFAINGVLSNLGTWSHWPIAYRELTTLGQDIPYALPASISPATLVHLIPGIALWWVGSRAEQAVPPSEARPSSAAEQS
jgi:hypothetical protein